MEVLGHQDPAKEQAVHLLPHFLEALDEVLTEARRAKDLCPAVSAAGDELQFTRTVSAMVDRHDAAQYRGDATSRGNNSFGRVPSGHRRPQKSGVCASLSANAIFGDCLLDAAKMLPCLHGKRGMSVLPTISNLNTGAHIQRLDQSHVSDSARLYFY